METQSNRLNPVCDEAEANDCDGRNTDTTVYVTGRPDLSEPFNQFVEMPELPGIESTLEERGKRYGSFALEAQAIMSIKRILFPENGPAIEMPDICRQAAEMIVVKLVRAMRGDPMYGDNWHDMIGYAKLVEDWIKLSEACADA